MYCENYHGKNFVKVSRLTNAVDRIESSI